VITIVDYGMGNLRNVHRACREIGQDAVVTSDREKVREAECLILPGVGAFGEAVRRFEALGLRGPILDHAERGRPLLGICLGMQLLFDSSDESPGANGLGLIKGTVRRLSGDVKIPHIGWNDISPVGVSPLFPAGYPGATVYFVHSYYVELIPETIARARYGVDISAAVRRDNVFGVQFHPEKSQNAGLKLLSHFASANGPEGNR